jgi:hypothetical protein
VDTLRYWWFDERSSRELARRIAAGGPGHRLLDIPYEKDGQPALRFRVVSGDGGVSIESHEAGHDVNDSHPCPPDCGGGG